MTQEADKDDPYDDVTHWVGNLPKKNTDSAERSTECDTNGPEQPDIQRKKLPMAEGE